MKPANHSEHTLIHAIIDGRFPPGTRLPAERELSTLLGVTRPTLREALTRLHRDGWITIQHGKPTLVNDYWSEGGLNVLSAIVRSGKSLDPHFVSWLLQVRRDLAPAYTKLAFEGDRGPVQAHLAEHVNLVDSPQNFAAFDWELHRLLTRASGNPIYSMILNGFKDLYQTLGEAYFAFAHTREASASFYQHLYEACEVGQPQAASHLCQQAMETSLEHWNNLQGGQK